MTLAHLTKRLANSATGYAAVIDDVLNIRSVSSTQNAAALNALYLVGIGVLSNCDDMDCTCKVDLLARLRPDIKIVPVNVEVAP